MLKRFPCFASMARPIMLRWLTASERASFGSASGLLLSRWPRGFGLASTESESYLAQQRPTIRRRRSPTSKGSALSLAGIGCPAPNSSELANIALA